MVRTDHAIVIIKCRFIARSCYSRRPPRQFLAPEDSTYQGLCTGHGGASFHGRWSDRRRSPPSYMHFPSTVRRPGERLLRFF